MVKAWSNLGQSKRGLHPLEPRHLCAFRRGPEVSQKYQKNSVFLGLGSFRVLSRLITPSGVSEVRSRRSRDCRRMSKVYRNLVGFSASRGRSYLTPHGRCKLCETPWKNSRFREISYLIPYAEFKNRIPYAECQILIAHGSSQNGIAHGTCSGPGQPCTINLSGQ